VYKRQVLFSACKTISEPVISIPQDAKPLAMRAGLEKRIDQDNDFAFDLLKQTLQTSGESNVFISPLSVSIALGMTWNGANGNTRTEMGTALKIDGMSANDMNEYYKTMQTTLPGMDPTTKLNIANSLWYKEGYPLKADFLKLNTDYFNAEIRSLDFEKAWAVDTINNWCARKTNQLIPKVLNEISRDAAAFLINAVYFKGIWRKKFDKKNTEEALFTDEKGQQLKVNMMYQKDTFAYSSDATAQYLDMPYGNKAFNMTVILPNEGKTTADVLNNLTTESWNNRLSFLKTREVEVFFPRFKQECKFELKDALQNMGMKQAFTDFADFSNMTDQFVKVSFVKHDTYVEVTEEGTEAAAVTVVGIEFTSIQEPPVTRIFRVNKPFVFVIREKSTGVILFIGKMGKIEKY
jgi:serpin B